MNYYTNRETDICEDNRYGKPERWHLIVFAILAVILAGVGVYFFMKYRSYDYATGYVLTKEFVSGHCRRTQCMEQVISSSMAAIFMFLPVISECSKINRTARPRGKGLMIYVAVMILISLIISGIPAHKTYVALTKEPTLRAEQITRKYSRSSKGSRNYYFEFSNGSNLSVSYNEYRSANYGDTYYIAYFGDTAIDCFDANTYSLPE